MGRGAGASTGSLAAELVRRLENLVIDGSLPPGHRLGTKSELRQQLGVAYGTLNEVIRALQLRGLVELRPGPGGGIFVAQDIRSVRLRHGIFRTSSDARSVQEALAVRNALEPLVLAEAARARTEGDVEALRGLLEKMAASRGNPDGFLSANWALHRQIAQSGGNGLLTAIYCYLLDHLVAAAEEAETVLSPKDADDTLRLHARLVEAVASGDSRRAQRAGQRHDTGPPGRGAASPVSPQSRRASAI